MGFVIKDGSKKHGSEVEFFDHKNRKVTPLTLAPLEEQDPLESNKAWQKVKEAILKSDMDTVGIEKSKIENAQREMRKKEQAEGREWQRRFFTKQESDPLFEKLTKPIGEKIENDKTNGIWRFDSQKAANAQQPLLIQLGTT